MRQQTDTRRFAARTVTIATVLALSLGIAGLAHPDDGSPASQVGTAQAADDMVRIPAGRFAMGYENAYDDERPVHTVAIGAFDLDRHEVTNRQFAAFVEATGYVTKAEKDGACWSYIRGAEAFALVNGADWRHPQGPNSSLAERWDHPVVCVNWYDAAAYARWAGKRLPTEAEWEYAARAGADGQFVANTATDPAHHGHGHSGHGHSAIGDDLSPSSKSHLFHAASSESAHAGDPQESRIEANIWQGHWPDTNALADGYFYTAPVAGFAPNAWGVSDMLGNVWEWTGDWYAPDYYAQSPDIDPSGAEQGDKRVARGGSWFCSPNYCGAYSSHYRGASPPDRGFNNVGFRCARDAR